MAQPHLVIPANGMILLARILKIEILIKNSRVKIKSLRA